jgi:hypothetical protein
LLSNLVVNPSHNLNYLSVRVDSEQDRLLVKDLIAAAAESLTSLELVTSTFPVDFTPLFEVLPINLRYLKCFTPTFHGSQRVTPTLDGNRPPLDYLTRLLPLLVNLKKLAIGISGYKDFSFLDQLRHLKDLVIEVDIQYTHPAPADRDLRERARGWHYSRHSDMQRAPLLDSLFDDLTSRLQQKGQFSSITIKSTVTGYYNLHIGPTFPILAAECAASGIEFKVANGPRLAAY